MATAPRAPPRAYGRSGHNLDRHFTYTMAAQLHSSVDRIRVVLISPSDVAKERAAARTVIEELNRGVATNRLVLWGWDTDARPGLHREGPQGLIDDLIAIQAADVVIGVFWTRLGSPTHDATSATEHELRRAWTAWRQSGRPEVMVYFSTRPYAATQPSELTQWQRLLEFKLELPSEQLWWQYTTPRDFERLLRVHLTRYVLDRDRGSARRTLSAEITPLILPSATATATPDRPDPGARTILGLRRRRRSALPTHSPRKRWLLIAATVTSALLLIALVVVGAVVVAGVVDATPPWWGRADRKVVWLIDGLADRDRALLGRACRLKLPELLLDDAEVSQRDHHRVVLGPIEGLAGRERALEQLPRTCELPARLLILRGAFEHAGCLLGSRVERPGVLCGAQGVREQPLTRPPLLRLPRPVRQHPVKQPHGAGRRALAFAGACVVCRHERSRRRGHARGGRTRGP